MSKKLSSWLGNKTERVPSTESPLRFLFFAAASLLGFLALVGFGLFNLTNRHFVEAGLGLAVAVVPILAFIISLRTPRRAPVYFVSFLCVHLFLLYLLYLGGEDGSLALWAFVVPVVALFLLGRRLGVVMIAISWAGIVLAFLPPPWGSPSVAYTPLFRIRYAVTYALVCGLAWAFESVRGRLASEAVARQEELEAANTEIARLSITDGMTGCYNRFYLDDRLPGEIRKAVRYDMPLALVLCDIDHFKRINDTHGHGRGDQVLQSFGDLLRQSVRDGVDWVTRYGGEEFVLLLPNTDVGGAAILAERIREMVADIAIPGVGLDLPITASFGVAEVRMQDETPATLLERADERLYTAKENGRNRVCTP